ncbi:hypothetical protein B0T10DRAFT_475166 [Thelonectria olida]|uniref:Carrier domain-containing protein n=1 Tax=Thelonectria olida TaxID=1576542 RepID=A0A9P8WBX9_9HYPO|nr:hypothetical protein B0T10DRAFT_475166 [Thelonectria olida]
MTPGAIIDDDYSSGQLAPKKLAQATRYQVPILTNLPEDASELEVLLLAWTLLLYRNSLGNHVQYSWRYSEIGSSTNTTLEVNTSKLQWNAADPVSTALEAIRGFLRNNIDPETTISVDRHAFLFNDEFAPPGSFTPFKEGPIMDWGNIQIQAFVSEGSLWLRPHWREPLGAEWMANHFAKSFVEILNTTLSDVTTPIGSVLELGEVDSSVLWGWNKDVPEAVEVCIHDLIDKQFKSQPEAPAICSWDGDLTYGDVDRYSTLLAHHLISLGLQVGDVVPLCFEKSRWTIVAVMAVTKAGGAFVLTDPSQPLQRRQTMASQVRATILLTSHKQAEDGALTAPDAKIVAVDEAALNSLADASTPETELPIIPPESLLYCIFTSGSTGMPKGVMINHTTYTTSAIARSTLIGYTKEARALDFTSYAFDVSIDSMLCTLLQGGCLCIPADEDRVNDLSGVIRRLGVNMANMTPSVARILDPDIIPSLNSLGLGGETCSAGDISIWGQMTRVVVGYGPSECTIGCTVNPSAAGKPYVSIGAATAGTIWLVDPDDHNKLVPVGAVGELLVEGPVVGQGYLRDPEKTAAAFIEDPEWLLAGGPGIPGRRGRLYKTGDLVRYDPDGEVGFLFVGRKDTQIKLRGQRVELGEIEYHIMNLLPHATDVVAEIIAPKSNGKESMLVAFIADREAVLSGNADHIEAEHIELPRRLREAVGLLDENLAKVLPVYMVPSAYIGMSKIPMLVSGKTDRKTLRALGANMSLQTSPEEEGEVAFTKPTTETETFLRDAWCRLLGLPEDQVSTSHNFFILGGESVLAMKLVPMVREHGYALSVPDVFNHPVLSDMAKVIQREDASSQLDMNIPAFSLLSQDLDRDALLAEAAEQCAVDKATIEDIYPCAPMQEIHVAFHNRSKEGYVAQRIAEIHFPEVVDKVKAAWDTVVRESPLLRTRIVEFKQHGFMQVVINQPAEWKTHTSLDGFLEEDKKEHMTPSTPLTRFTIVNDEASGKTFFVWTAHHAIYDGWSTDLILDHAKNAWAGLAVSRTAEFKHFVRFVEDPARESSKDYWRAQLEGATGPQFPSLPSRSYMPEPDSLEERFIAVDKAARTDITIATIIRAAWALVASQYVMSDDVVFGETFTGRTIPVPGAEQIEGPLLATVPVRVRLDRTASVQEFLQSIQEQSVIRNAHEHLGIQNIRRLSDDAQIACEVTMGLVVQPKEPAPVEPSADLLPAFRSGNAAIEALHFNSYPIMLACSLEEDGFTVYASFDSDLLSRPQVQRVLAQFERAISQLRGDQTQSMSDITCLSEGELERIWEENKAGPISLPSISSTLSSGDKYPTIRYVPWITHPANAELLMPIGTVGELLVEGADEIADVDTPEWLIRGAPGVPGRHGRLYRTGDLVKYNDDLSLVFVGRKEAMTSIDGRVVDLAATDIELERLLPANTAVASQLIIPPGSTSQTPLVVAFIQERPGSEAQMVNLGVEKEDKSIPLSATISTELATTIIGLKKALVETLPPYAIPSVCIPVAQTTDSGEPVDVKSLNGMAEHVTLALVQELRKSFATLQSTIANQVPLTSKEKVLISMWSKFLDIEEAKLSLDDNFFRLGGDSIVAMRMVSALRRAGYRLAVADMFQNMQLRGMANAIDDSQVEVEQPKKVYSPFSLLNVGDVDAFLAESVRPQLADSTWSIQDVLPVTGPQQQDVKTTVSAHRSAVQSNMLYFDDSIDTSRLVESFQHLVSQHPILRTVFVEHNEEILQVVLENMDVSVSESTTESPVDTYCKELAEADINNDSAFVLGAPFLHLFIVHGNNEKGLMIRISHAQYDGVSLPEVLRQLEVRYRGEDIPASAPFASYIQYSKESKAENVNFWRNALEGSSPTEIIAPAEAGSTTAWMTKPVDVSNSSPDTTLAVLLNAAWAKVQAQHLNISDVTFGGIVSGRDVGLADVDGIMGPCYQYMPVRVKFEADWTATQLLEHVRNQYLEGSQRATLGFREVQQECTNWSADTSFFPSFVNHLNKEFFDSLPFADTRCRVDYTIPHAEPATPPRVVSFLENGKSFVGIEADEERREFWEARLEELASAVEGFVNNPQAAVL